MLSNMSIAAILGIVQGITEFLPISSSGHLVILQHILGIKSVELFLDVSLHIGTLFAVIIFLRKELISLFSSILTREPNKVTTFGISSMRLILYIIVGTFFTGMIGLLGEKHFTFLFAAPAYVGISLIITGIILLLSKLGETRTKSAILSLPISIIIGLFQGIAVIPGISRSGTTISFGLLLGLKRDIAFKFSFLLSIPAVLGALFLEMRHFESSHFGLVSIIIGMVLAFVTGYLSLIWLKKLVNKGRFYIFAPYCILLGILTFITLK